jgi:hypothetical protein
MQMTSHPRLSGLVLGFLVALLLPSPVHPLLSTQGNVATSYPNDSEGLLRLLNNMLVAAKSDDQSKLQSLIRETEIPNYQSWFTTNFSQEKGESWAEPYGRWLEKHEKEFQELLLRLAQMDGEFAVDNMDTAKSYDLLNGPFVA